jgi:hypothetical protein
MALKTAIRKAITDNSKYSAVKFLHVSFLSSYMEDELGYKTMIIEVQVKKKKK